MQVVFWDVPELHHPQLCFRTLTPTGCLWRLVRKQPAALEIKASHVIRTSLHSHRNLENISLQKTDGFEYTTFLDPFFTHFFSSSRSDPDYHQQPQAASRRFLPVLAFHASTPPTCTEEAKKLIGERLLTWSFKSPIKIYPKPKEERILFQASIFQGRAVKLRGGGVS